MEAKHNQVRGRDTAWSTRHRDACGRWRPASERTRASSLAVNQTIVDAEGAADYRRLNAFLKPLGHPAPRRPRLRSQRHLQPRRRRSTPPPRPAATSPPSATSRSRQIAALVGRGRARCRPTWPWPERLAKRYYIRGIRNRVLRGRGSPNPPCVALNAHLRILPNGDVPTCQFNTRKVGNLRRQSFREIWFGPAAGSQRDWVRKCPGCWAECEILPNAFYTGDLWRRQSQAVAPVTAYRRNCARCQRPDIPIARRVCRC